MAARSAGRPLVAAAAARGAARHAARAAHASRRFVEVPTACPMAGERTSVEHGGVFRRAP